MRIFWACWCYTCGREIRPHGIMNHRAMHRRRKERCVIRFTDGRVVEYEFDTK